MNWKGIIASTCMGLAACSHPATQDTPPLRKEIVMTQKDDAAMRKELNFQPVKWPLRFKKHSFVGLCYGTLKCSIWYNGFDHGDWDPSPPSSEIGPKYLDHLLGTHSVKNFPAPAEVKWRSADGTDHKAEIDIGDIFRDELLRHNVRREEVDEQPDGRLNINPSIFLEVNDRIIRVHMRPWIPLKKPVEIAGQMPDYIYDDLILVKTYNY